MKAWSMDPVRLLVARTSTLGNLLIWSNWVSREFTILKESEHSRSELAFFLALVKDSTSSIMRTTKVAGSANFSFTLSNSLCTSLPLSPSHCSKWTVWWMQEE